MAAAWESAPLVDGSKKRAAWEDAPEVGAQKAEQPKAERSMLDEVKQGVGNLVAGGVRGAGSIGATLLWPVDKATDIIKGDRGPNVSGLVTGKQPLSRNEERRQEMDSALESMGAEPDSWMYKGGKLGGEIAGTAGTGNLLVGGLKAAPLVAKYAPRLAVGGLADTPLATAAPSLLRAIQTGGMSTGATTTGIKAGAQNMLTRIAGGGITGTAAAGLIDPSEAWKGGVAGAALPPALAGAGKVGHAIGQRFATTKVAESLRAFVEAARNAGYVIPPTQAKPTMVNKVLEGFAGKLTTAQNASAKNQAVTNNLVKKAIGAKDLTPEALAEVRSAANSAYDELGQVGIFQADDAFRESVKKAGAASSQMRKDFPELVNKEVDDLVEGLSSRAEFDSQSAIEAIKQFRFSGSANKASLDPAKKALGKAQMKIAGALEDLIDRNLQANGAQDLLTNYRAARQTLAKVYDVEKALNTASGNIDARKLGTLLAKGRPLTGELKTVAEFANRFPKAAQLTERMGSLPQVSPLDFGALGTMSALTSNPLLMAGVLARPAARSLVLSNAVQNRLATQPAAQNRLMELLANPAAEQLLYRSAPAVAASR